MSDNHQRMRNKRYILRFLFFISIIMLVVPVVPHHHHSDGIICMKNDITPEAQCPTHNHHQDNDACCNDECQARFHSPVPTVQADFGQPQHIFVAILFDDFIFHNLFKPQEQRIKNDGAYRENLHGTNITRAFGLRAPPQNFV